MVVVSTKMLLYVLLVLCVASFFYIDLSRLPRDEDVMLHITRLLERNGDCDTCGEVLRSLDTLQLARSTSLIKATQGYDKSHGGFVRACEEDPNILGCDTALERDRTERIKRASSIIGHLSQLNRGKEKEVVALLHRRYDDFMIYLLNEKEQEACLTCVVGDEDSLRLVAKPHKFAYLGYTWYHLYPINERHQKFCWEHCEGMLTYSERIYLWAMRFYLVQAVRYHLVALQQEGGTVACILGQFILLSVILQRYVVDTKGGGGGGGAHMDGNPTGVQRGSTRRAAFGRGRSGGGGRRD